MNKIEMIVNGSKKVYSDSVTGLREFFNAYPGHVERWSMTMVDGRQFGSKHPVNATADFFACIERFGLA